MLDRFLIVAVLVAVAMLSPAIADESKPSCFAGAHLGSGGIGAGGGCQISSRFALRLAIEGAETDRAQNIDGVDYEADVDLGFNRVQVDWFPAGSGFYVSGGIAKIDLSIDGTANPTAPIQVGSVIVNPADVGFLELAARFDNVAPYLGVGWLAQFGNRLSLRSELGVSKVDEPEVTLVERETSFISDADIQAEVDEILDEYDDDLSLYPYLKFGLEYRFR